MKVVLLHAFPLDERMWAPQRDALGEADVELPNLYSLGTNSIDAWASALLDRLDGELALVGASMGGYCALAMARQAPERIRGLMLVGSRAGADSEERREIRNQMIEVLRSGGVEAWRPAAPFEVPPGYDAGAFIRALEALRDRRDATDVVSSWQGPFLLVVGSDDELLSVSEARRIAEASPQGRLEVVEGAGHIVNVDRPKRFNELLLEFLASARR